METAEVLENIILPTFDTLVKLEGDKKILAGGLPVGDRAFVFIVEAASNEEVVDSRDLSPTRFSCSFPHLLALDLVLSLFAPHGKVLCDSDIETSVSVNRHNIISYLSPCPHTSFRVR